MTEVESLRVRVDGLLEANNREVIRRRRAERLVKELKEKLLRCAPLRDRSSFEISDHELVCSFCGEVVNPPGAVETVLVASGLSGVICSPCVDAVQTIFEQEMSR